MTAHIFDYEFQKDVYSTSEITSIYDEKSRTSRWVEIESLLAKVQGELGVIPESDAKKIVKMCDFHELNHSNIVESYKTAKNTLAPVLSELYRLCGESSKYVHYGVTTQDIIDTGEMIALKKSLEIIFRDLNKLSCYLTKLTIKHKNSTMVGRTHGQNALPITFGLKTSIWLDEINRHKNRIYDSYHSIHGQLGGAVGTLAAIPKGEQVKKKLMEYLDLSYSLPAWHNSRDRVADVAVSLILLTTTLSKFANEIILLSYTEINELRECSSHDSVINSSAMPHKHNPVLCQRIVAMATQNRSLLSVVIENMSQSHERDPRHLWSEWISLPQIVIFSGAILSSMLKVFDSLSVDTDNMKKNLYNNKEAVISEAIMYGLSERFGKQQAYEITNHILVKKHADNNDSKPSKLDNILDQLDEDAQEIIKNPEQYTGQSQNIIDSILSKTKDEPNVNSVKNKKINLTPIGVVNTGYNQINNCPVNTRFCENDSEIELFDEYKDGLRNIENSSHIFCFYWLDKANRDSVYGISKLDNKKRGSFSTRTPNRPNPIGVAVVKLKRVEKNKLFVSGLDCLNGTLLLDIKPYIPENDAFTDATFS